MRLFKLTDKNDESYGGCKWEAGKSHFIKKDLQSKELCSSGVIHAYKNKNLSLLLNPIHANFTDPQMWQSEGEIVCEDWGKVGTWRLKTIKKLPVPKWYLDETTRKKVQVMFAIICAESVLHCYEKYNSKDTRPRKAIEAAREYLKHPTAYAANAANAADAAAYAAYAAANAAYAAYAAAHAADAADCADIDFSQLADQAVKRCANDP